MEVQASLSKMYTHSVGLYNLCNNLSLFRPTLTLVLVCCPLPTLTTTLASNTIHVDKGDPRRCYTQQICNNCKLLAFTLLIAYSFRRREL